MPIDLAERARLAEVAADRARVEIVKRFRAVAVERKPDGSPVTEADRAAERAVRAVLEQGDPGVPIVGEELDASQEHAERKWVVDPIDGTIAYSRGIPLFATLLAYFEQGSPRLGLIDLPVLGERYVGWRAGGCRRNGETVRVSRATRLEDALVAHGDPLQFERAGERAAFERMAREIPLLRGYTDAFGHAQVLGGGVDVMVDPGLRLWDAAPSQVLVPEAGGACRTLPAPDGTLTLVIGAPALVEQLVGFLARRG